MDAIILKKGREASLLRRHPWIFTGAIADMKGNPASGDSVLILSAEGEKLAVGAFSPASQIRVRVWSFAPEEPIDREFFRQRLTHAFALRHWLGVTGENSGYRLINAESDGFPGVIVDWYAGFFVCQFLSAGAAKWQQVITGLLMEMFSPAGVFEKSTGEVMAQEGLAPRTGVLMGASPPELLEIREKEARYLVDLLNGHKTGFYLDQRDNRALVGEVSQGKMVLNCFSYTGGFGIQALLGGAKALTHLDISEEAMALCLQNQVLNGFPEDRAELMTADVFTALRKFRDSGRRFDIIILDPPKFAPSAAAVPKAARGYKDINLLAMKLLNPGGILFTFSCSGHVPPALFQKIVADAAVDANRPARILKFLHQAPDHPVALSFPEGLYLKGLMVQVI